MHTPSKPGHRARSWFAGILALSLLGLGQSAVASPALAEETPEPTPSAETSTPAPKDEPKPSVEASAEPTASAKPSEPAKTTASKPAASSAATKTRSSAEVAAVADATAAKQGTRYEYAPGTEYWVPAQWIAGEDLVISGSGWRNTAGDAGSIIALKLDEGGVSTKLDVKHPVTGAVQANKTIYAVVQADAGGEWTLRVPYPTTANSTAGWSVGENHALRLLTGSMLTGDVIRTAAAETTVTAVPAPTPTPTATATATPTPTPTATPTVRECAKTGTGTVAVAPTTVGLGGVLRVTGSGFCHPSDGGSTIAIKLDAGGVSRLDTSVHANKSIWAIVDADADGDFAVDLQLPDGTDAGTNGSLPALTVGTHTLQLLTGSLKTVGDVKDTQRTLVSDGFTVTSSEANPADPATQPPSWAHDTITVGGATAWVQSEVPTAAGSTLTIKGTHWTDQAGTGASTVAVKLNHAGGQYARTGPGIVAPSGVADPTIWKLLAPAGTPAHPNVITVGADGNFEIEIDLPEGLRAGQLLTAQFLSGRFGANDTVRNVSTKPLVVGGVPYVDVPDDEDVTCAPTSGTPVVSIAEPRASLGGTLRVTGAGFCHPGAKRGGSTIAIKIDEGGISRLNDALHSNRTIWAIVQAKAADGTFDIELQLPDGTTKGANGSDPAFTEGAHTLRLLTGSLKAGDVSRTVQSATFVVGSYRPTAMPDPVEATEDLTSATRNGVAVTTTSAALTVTVPGAQAGDWIYLNTYSGGSPTSPWGSTWFRADAGGKVRASLAGVTLPTGTSKLSVQSGNEGEVGALLGWTPLTVTGEKADQTPTTTTTTIRTIVTTTTTTSSDDSDDSSAPTSVPKAPVQRASQLTGLSNGDATAKADGTKLTVTLPKGAADQWVYVYIYSGASLAKAGWVRLSDAKAFTVDLKGLDDGRHRVVAVNADGDIVGWVEASKGNVTTVADTGSGSPQPPAAPGDPASATLTQPGAGSMDPVLIGAAVAVLAAGLVGLRRLAAKPKGVA